MANVLTKQKYEYMVRVLKEELVPAMGCTEPIAIAYAAAKARDVLGHFPDRADIKVSGSIIKNAKSVVVPHTDGMQGIEAALIAGLVGGSSEHRLEVLSYIGKGEIARVKEIRNTLPITVGLSDSPEVFDIGIRLFSGADNVYVRITDRHTNIVTIEKNGKTVFIGETDTQQDEEYKEMSVEEIVEFSNTVHIQDVKETLQRQINYNMKIAEEGLSGNYGANIGTVYLSAYTNDLPTLAKAYASAGSDARMSGCELPVIINSGSGNQGMTASIPVIIYARNMGLDEDKLYRALCISNLITIHVKRGIGTLSAYCGAVVAGAGAGCGIAYLHGGGFSEIAHTLVNALAIDSGLVCDGAKASCAAKIATAVENGILGFNLYRAGKQFLDGDGIVKKGVENTIKSVTRLAREGMKETDREILKIMLNE